jgi:hypothetical protein
MASQITKPVFQPTGTSIQYGDLLGNISHTGTLGSNISLTPPLTSTFPTTPTGDSLGHYHYTEVGSGALKFLNACGSGTGGHQFFTSNSTTAPFKTGTIDQNGFTILKNDDTSNLDENSLSITNGTTSSYLSLINDPSNSSLSLSNVGISGVYGAGGTTITNNNNNSQSIFQSFQTTIAQNTDNLTLNSAYIGFSKTGGNSAIFLANDANSPIVRVTDTNSDVSILTATDLTFNTVSLKTQVETNTTDISNINTSIDSLDPLIITQKTTTNQYISAAITADGRPPTAPTATITQQYAFTPAWYFKNTVSGYKINWYIGGDIGMTVSQVLGVYMNIFNPSMTSNDNCPFITVYTTNDTPSPPNFYKSKRTYLFNQSVTPVVNTRYFMFQDVSGTCPTPFHYGSVLNNMELSTVSGSQVGLFGPNEVILAFAIGTNSASAVNSVEFAINKFGIMTPYGTQEVSFIPIT